MKILICGGRGQLGHDCTRVMAQSHEVVSTDLEELDITDFSAVEERIRRIAPHVVINCAAYTRVDACETEQEVAWKVNVDGPRHLALAVEKQGIGLIHVSTDYVFDGTKKVPEPYVEEDTPHPVSFYGKTKFEGEEAVREIAPDHVIVRTAWLYGHHGPNFLKTMLRLASRNPHKEIKVVNDQFGCPTWSYRLALQMARLVEAKGRGTYHATSEGHGTWYELATCFLQKMGIAHHLVPCTSAEYPTPALRPKNSILGNRHLKEEGLNMMIDWEHDVDQFVSLHREDLMQEVA
ncbi:MAG: dTDP-4-dehydrorhamnose reductase [Thermodesulfobacteriota bacterium]|nr:dTDP-4-dehydrorhamnose reductase [Thermodesulfobacteriota bacterium]